MESAYLEARLLTAEDLRAHIAATTRRGADTIAPLEHADTAPYFVALPTGLETHATMLVAVWPYHSEPLYCEFIEDTTGRHLPVIEIPELADDNASAPNTAMTEAEWAALPIYLANLPEDDKPPLTHRDVLEMTASEHCTDPDLLLRQAMGHDIYD